MRRRKIFKAMVWVILVCLARADSLASEGETDGNHKMAPPVIVRLSGRMFKAIEIAARELAQHGLDIEKYKIEAMAWKGSIYISFLDPKHEDTRLGGGPELLGYGVELDSETLTVIRSHFSK